MRRAALACLAAALACAATAPAAAGDPFATQVDPFFAGPFAGVVAQGETAVHAYSTHPEGTMCAAVYIPHLFVATLGAAPADRLLLEVGGVAVETAGGQAVATFVANWCTAFPVHVTGLDVAAGAYAVTVSHVRAAGGPGGPGDAIAWG